MPRRLAAAAFAAGVFLAVAPAQAAERQLSPDEMRATLIGKTVDSGDAWLSIHSDGTATGEHKGTPIKLTYRIKDNGQWCRTFRNVSKCQTVTREGDVIRWYDLTGDMSFEGRLKD